MISRLLTFIGLFTTVAGIILLLAGSRALAYSGGPWDGPTAEDVWLPASPHAKRATNPKRVSSFKSWKKTKINSCSDRLKLLRKRLQQARSARDGHKALMLEQDISQEKWRVQVAKDLTVKDYISLYVIPQLPAKGSRTRLREVARLLSREEVAQVLETYVQMVNSPQVSSVQMRLQTVSAAR